MPASERGQLKKQRQRRHKKVVAHLSRLHAAAGRRGRRWCATSGTTGAAPLPAGPRAYLRQIQNLKDEGRPAMNNPAAGFEGNYSLDAAAHHPPAASSGCSVRSTNGRAAGWRPASARERSKSSSWRCGRCTLPAGTAAGRGCSTRINMTIRGKHAAATCPPAGFSPQQHVSNQNTAPNRP